MIDIAPQEAERLFLEFLEREGLTPSRPGDVRADGKLRRYVVRGCKPGERTGACVLHGDGWPAGWAMDWRRGGEKSMWKYPKEELPPLSDEEKQRYAAEMEERTRAREKAEQELKGEAAKRAKAMWKAATRAAGPGPVTGDRPPAPHKYVVKKKLKEALGARLLGNDLVIPVYTPGGNLVSLQFIPPEGKKLFLTHGRTAGCFCVLAEEEADRGKYVFVCEGWATGVTIHEATGCAVAVAFYAGNLRSVTETMRERYPGKLVLAPDDDFRKMKGNAGMSRGFEVAEEFDIPLAIPPFTHEDADMEGTDWNDYAAIHDIEATAEAIYAAAEKWEEKAVLERETSWPVWADVTEKGKPKPTDRNLEILLRKQGITLRYNEVAKEAEMNIPGERLHEDGKSAAELSHVLSLCARFGLPDEHAANYLSLIAMKRGFNPVRDWILSKPWDERDRLEELYATLQTEREFSEDFKRLILRRWLISCAAAVFDRDFRNRGVLVLQGEQSLGKTAWLESFVPRFSEFFTSSPNMDIRSKDDVKRVLGYWIVELGELEGVLRLDMPRLKAFLTLRKDEMRLPYGHGMTKYRRRTVFCASVNQFQFLNDPTGNSRWWVIPCAALNYRHKIDIQQLWAQIYCLYRNGERWWLDKDEEDELTRSNWMFEQADEIEDLIKAGFDWEHFEEDRELNLCDYLTATEVLKMCKVEQPTKSQAMKAGEILRTLTRRPAERKAGGKRCYLVPRKTSTYPP